ncbi:ComEC/Rec2 family competence protein [Anabaena sp. 4-3]|uniref:ComEC/Rec2 family competence protein n=1 Tax=Anabaena sp. 4-3 TaxID=1811979 RepID=UPI0008357F11|nr:ComEC/Rec2 family competence protein [Anabaena sp. 4-3]
MFQSAGVIICIAYILGLLLTAVPGGGVWVLLLGIVGAVLSGSRYTKVRKLAQSSEAGKGRVQVTANFWQFIPHARICLIAGLIGLLASFYLQWRVPAVGETDISQFVPPANSNSQEQLVIVRGEIMSSPRVTRSQRGQFWLEASQLGQIKNEKDTEETQKGVTGKLYVTVPLLQATGLYPGETIEITGMLYKPKGASNPGGFDFQKFLKQEGAFAGLMGRQINIVDENRQWGWWQVRERIVRSQVRGLDVPEGSLVSAMVLGSKAVDLPYDIRDMFVKAGLAHALAASGFQTSLILSVILQLTKRASKAIQVSLGSLALIIFLFLTGFQAAVLRAVIMGFAALLGLALNRKVKQLGSLLLAATLLLLFNPLWIWDLGFQLSFLATLGLVVSSPAIINQLGWLPPAIASLIAVPLAATIWTLPIILYNFSVVAVYSLPLNVLTTPFISIISIGGMVSAVISLISPEIGSSVASVLHLPTYCLIKLVEFCNQLPSSSVAVGSLSLWQLLTAYTLILLVCFIGWWQKRWVFATLITVGLVLFPAWHSANTLTRITLLEAGAEPVIVIQDQGKVTLINSGDEGTGRFTILPFLQQQGINHIDWGIATDFQRNNSDAWLEVLQNLPIKNFYAYAINKDNPITNQAITQVLQKDKGFYQMLPVGQPINTGSTVAQLINEQPILQLQVFGQTWLLVGNVKAKEVERIMKAGGWPNPQVLWCNSESLKDLVISLQPQVAIAGYGNLDSNTLAELSKTSTKLFLTAQDGAVQWTPQGEFESFIQVSENKSSAI